MKTPFYERHLALKAKIVPFAGWQMPIQYKGILEEHRMVREQVGIFDVSHMGRVGISGPDAEKLLNFLSTNEIKGKKEGSATYTVWCNSQGGSVDDLLVYKEASDRFFVIVNASNREKDLEHLQNEGAGFRVEIHPFFEEAILAVQGPRAKEFLIPFFPKIEELAPKTFSTFTYQDQEIIVSATGYTGSSGFELFGPKEPLLILWDRLIAKGVEPIGLGARDTLRLEMGYALYGHELSETIAPIESVSAWTVKEEKGDFLGKQALLTLENSPYKRSQVGVILQDPGIAREGYPVLKDGEKIGQVTSGTFSPSLRQSIALVMIEGNLGEGEIVEVEIRGRQVPAKVVELPFWRA
jgi:aminomethyltransferase